MFFSPFPFPDFSISNCDCSPNYPRMYIQYFYFPPMLLFLSFSLKIYFTPSVFEITLRCSCLGLFPPHLEQRKSTLLRNIRIEIHTRLLTRKVTTPTRKVKPSTDETAPQITTISLTPDNVPTNYTE